MSSVITALWVPIVVCAHLFSFFWLAKAYFLESPRAFAAVRRWLGGKKLKESALATAVPSPNKDKDVGAVGNGANGVVDLDSEEQVVLTLSQKRSTSKDVADPASEFWGVETGVALALPSLSRAHAQPPKCARY